MERVIFVLKILVGVLNYIKWQDVMINVLLKDDFFDVVYFQDLIIKVKLVMRVKKLKLRVF